MPDAAKPPFALNGAAFLTFFDRALLPPLVVVVALDFGVAADEVGQALTAYIFGYAVAQLGWGAISARIGRPRAIAIAIVFGAIGTVATVFATGPETLLIGRIIAGVGFAGVIPSILVYVGDTVQLSVRPAAMADVAAALSLGMAVGTAVGAVTGAPVLWRIGFAVVGVLSLAVLVLVWRLPEPPREAPPPYLRSVLRVLRDRWAAGILVLTFLEGVLLVGLLSFLPVALILAGSSTLVAGLVTSIFGVAVIAWSRLVRRVARRFSAAVVLAVAGVAAIIAFGLLAVVLTPWSVALSAVLLGLAWAFGHTQLQAWMTDAVARDRPAGMGLFSVALFAGGAAGAAVANLVVPARAFTGLFAGATVVALVFTIAAVLVRRGYTASTA